MRFFLTLVSMFLQHCQHKGTGERYAGEAGQYLPPTEGGSVSGVARIGRRYGRLSPHSSPPAEQQSIQPETASRSNRDDTQRQQLDEVLVND